MTKLSENECALIRGNPFYGNGSFEKRAVETIDALREKLDVIDVLNDCARQDADVIAELKGELAEAIEDRDMNAGGIEEGIRREDMLRKLLKPNPACPSGHPMAYMRKADPPTPNRLMGAFVECTHQTPYYSCVICQAKRCTLCQEKEAAVAAALEKAANITVPIQSGDGPMVDCPLGPGAKAAIRALIPTQTPAQQDGNRQ